MHITVQEYKGSYINKEMLSEIKSRFNYPRAGKYFKANPKLHIHLSFFSRLTGLDPGMGFPFNLCIASRAISSVGK